MDSQLNDIKPNETINIFVFLLSILVTYFVFWLARKIYLTYKTKMHVKQKKEDDSRSTGIKKRSKSEIRSDYLSRIFKLKEYTLKNPSDSIYIISTLSVILRGFIQEFYEILALPRNKSELSSVQITELHYVLTYSYKIQFELGIVPSDIVIDAINIISYYIENAS